MVEFDPDKDRRNVAKHGVSLFLAARFDWTSAVIYEDRSEDYGERREVAIGFIGATLHVYVYTLRDGDEERAISLRRADRKDAKRYARETEG